MSLAPPAELGARIRELGPWFHDIDLHGVHTAPDHPLGTFLDELWALVEPAFPSDLTGKSVLDIGCNAGFYSLKFHHKGARVTGLEHDPRYLAQARFAAEVLAADIEYLLLDVYDVDRLEREFDYVLFMGVLYHLRHPLYALEKVVSVVRRKMVFQSMVRGSRTIHPTQADYPITDRDVFLENGFPAVYFVEHQYAGDPTNWWIPNQSAVEAMLRSSGFRIDARIGDEVYYCSPAGRVLERGGVGGPGGGA